MKPIDIMPDNQNVVEKNSITIRKGSVAAFMANIKLLETGTLARQEEIIVIVDIIELMPALLEFGVFEVFKLRSKKAKQIIKQHFPAIEI